MTNCKYITKNGRCGLKGSYAYRHGCFGEDMCRCREPMTNADRIRAMSDEELKDWYCKNRDCGDCDLCRPFGCRFKDWLQQPYREENKHEP